MKLLNKITVLLFMGIGSCAFMATAQAKELKVGVIISLSGPYADDGTQIKNGIDLYMQQHGDSVAGHDIKVVYKDDGGIEPALVRRQAIELINNDNVDILAGFTVTPNALAAAPVIDQSKIPSIVMVAASPSVTTKSRYILRTSQSLSQSAFAIAQWAADNDIKKVYSIVADYSPGKDVEKAFKEYFEELGGEIVGEVRTPTDTVDYSPYLQRIKDAKPDALFTFQPNGQPAISFVKSLSDVGIQEAGIRVLASGALTSEHLLPVMGSSAEGIISALNYSEAHDSEENHAFVKAYHEAFPDSDRPSLYVIAAYDGMHMIYETLKKLEGQEIDGDAFIDAVDGLSWMSPRGPITVDGETGELIQNEYIRVVEKDDEGHLFNHEFETIEDVH